eukprot:2119635-Pleurochrysis_carterae.AAC.7
MVEQQAVALLRRVVDHLVIPRVEARPHAKVLQRSKKVDALRKVLCQTERSRPRLPHKPLRMASEVAARAREQLERLFVLQAARLGRGAQ